jgi:predicted enzyme related to lactoylglutathione lyase
VVVPNEPNAVVSSIVVDCRDPVRLASFWQQLLGGVVVEYPELGVVALRAPGVTFDFVVNNDQKVTKNRWHLDVASPEADATVAAAIAAGASRADDVCLSPDFVVLRDPEGNEFCVLRGASADRPWAPP